MKLFAYQAWEMYYMGHYVPNKCHSIHLGLPFLPSQKESWAVCLLCCLCSEWALLLSQSGASVDFPTKTDHDVIGALYGDVLMMQAILIDDTYIDLKRVMSCSDDERGFRWCHLHKSRGIKGRSGRGAGLFRFLIPSSRVELIELS